MKTIPAKLMARTGRYLYIFLAITLGYAAAWGVEDSWLGVTDAAAAPAAADEARAGGEWARWGWLQLVYLGDEAAARDGFARALAADPDDVNAAEGTSWLDFAQGRMTDAFNRELWLLDAHADAACAPLLTETLSLFDGVTAAYPDAVDLLADLAHRTDAPAASREAAGRALESALVGFGRWDEAEAFARERGYLGRFMACGVFEQAGLADLDVPFEPESRLNAAPPVTTGEPAWRAVNPCRGEVDVGGALGFNLGVAYAATTVDLPAGEFVLEVTSDDWYRVWLGGVPVGQRHPRDGGGSARATFPFTTDGGAHVVLVKTIQNHDPLFNNDGRWAFKIRILRPEGGEVVGTEGDVTPLIGAAPASPRRVATLTAAPEAPPAGPLDDFYRGLAYADAGDYDAAVAASDRATAAAPACALFCVAGAYVRMLAGGEYYMAEAKALLRRARVLDADCVLAIEELGVFALSEGKRDEGVKYYRESLEREPAYVSSYCGLADAAWGERWGPEVVRQADAALALNPNAPRAWKVKGDYYYDRDNTPAAAECFERYVALRASDVDARLKFAECLILLGRLDDARAQYEAVLRAAPYREEGFLGLTDVAARRGDDAAARAWFARGAAALPGSANLRRQAGYYLVGHGAAAEGYALLKEALALDGSDYRLRYYLEEAGAIPADAVSRALAVDGPALAAAVVTPEKYPHADTVMVMDQTVEYVNADYSFREENYNLIRILNDKGRERWGEITVMSEPGTEVRAARTYLPAGGAVDATSIKESNGVKVISMEQVVPGATLEVAYDLNFNRRMVFGLPDYYSQPFFMAELGEALARTRFAVVVPAAAAWADRLRFDVAHQRLKARKVRGDGRTAYIFERKNVAALVEEPMMPAKDAFAPYVRATTLGDVGRLAAWYMGELWGKFELDEGLRRRLATTVAGAPDDRARAAAVYYDVVKTVESPGGSVYYPAPARLTAFRGQGRTVDRAVLIVALCRELGIPAKLALVGTGGGKEEWRFITPDLFDTVLVYFPTLGAEGTYADPLLDTLAFGEVWTAAYRKPALLVDDAGYAYGRVPAAPFEKDCIRLDLALALEPSGRATFEGRREYRGLRGAYRDSFTNPEDQASNVEIALSSVLAGATVTSYGFENLNDLRGDFALTFEGEVPNYARARGEGLGLGAVPYPFNLGQVFIAAEKRHYPLRIERPEAWEDDVRLNLPAGYRLAARPRDVRFAVPGASYTVEYTVDGDKLEIRRRLFVDQGDISPRAYRAFVRFCRDVDAWEKEELKLTPAGGP